MKNKIEFNCETVRSITFTPVKTLTLVYKDSLEVKHGLFNLSKRTFTDFWMYKDKLPYYCDYYGSWQKMYSTDRLTKDSGKFQRIDGTEHLWFEKAFVSVSTDSDTHTARFKDDILAEEFIKEVKKKNGGTFQIIINE